MLSDSKNRNPVEDDTPELHPVLVRAMVEIVLLKSGYRFEDIRNMTDLEVQVRVLASVILKAQESKSWLAKTK